LKPEYKTLYLEKAKQFDFKPADLKTKAGRSEAIRYLLACGFIPATPENIALVKGEEFYMDAHLLPESLVDAVKNSAVSKRDEWEYDEESENEELDSQPAEITGVWIKDEKVTGAKIDQRRKIDVTTTYNVGLEVSTQEVKLAVASAGSDKSPKKT